MVERPFQTLTGRPPIGNGATAALGPGLTAEPAAGCPATAETGGQGNDRRRQRWAGGAGGAADLPGHRRARGQRRPRAPPASADWRPAEPPRLRLGGPAAAGAVGGNGGAGGNAGVPAAGPRPVVPAPVGAGRRGRW
ncbi:hypothetical protein ABLO14_19075 [Mycobacterium tuberculosis]